MELVADDKDSDRSAVCNGRANRHTGGVRSKNTGLVGAEGTLASHVNDGRRAVGFKSVVDACHRSVRDSRKRIAALRIGNHS